MAISDKDITIRINVDNTGAIQVLDQTGESIRKVGQNSQQSESELSNLIAGAAKAYGVFLTLTTALSGLNQAFEDVARFEGVQTGFNALQGGASEAARSLEELRTSTFGLVSDFELMRQANQAVSLGLPKEEFDELANAAVKLGAKVGQDAVSSIESLIAAVGRASPLMLDNLGIKLKMAEAEEIYAEKLRKSVDQLTEAEKAEAFKEAAMQKIIEASNQLNDVQETSAVSYQQLKTAIENTTQSFSNFLVNLPAVSTILQEILSFVNDLGNGFNVLAAQGEATGLKLKASFLSVASVLQKVQFDFAGALQTEQEIAATVAEIKNVEQAYKKAGEAASKALNEATTGTGKLGSVTKITAKELEALKKKQEELAEAAKKAYEEKIKESNQLQDVVSKSEEYKQLLKEIEAGTVSNADATGRLALIYSDKSKLLFEIERKEILLAEALAKVGEGAKLSMEEILVLNKALAENKKELDGTSKSAEKAGSVFGQLLQQFGANADLATGFQFLTSFNFGDGAIAQDLDRLSQVLQSQDLLTAGFKTLGFVLEDLQNFGKSTEETIKGLTSVFLGPINFGLDDFIADVFSSENAGKLARDKVDTFFEDLLDANQVSLVIDGQLQKIKDLAENDIAGLFEDLDKTTPEGSFLAGAFGNIGTALEEQFGIAEDISGQIGAILFNNVGGSLNNLQILFQELGIAQEDLAQAIEEAWLDGDVSAQQFLATTSQINNLYQKGIPDGVGRTDLAFLNLIESAGAGRQVLDALGDLAVEAQENTAGNIQTLDDLKASLLASGADAEKVNQAFTAIANAGITSLDQLANVSVSTAATISSELESVGGFFTEIGDDIASIKQQMDEIRDKEVNIKFNVTTNVDENTQKYVGTSNLPIGEGVQ